MSLERPIGDRTVWPVGLGTAFLSLDDVDDELSIRTIHAAMDAGVTLIDTAHAYTTLAEPTHSESIVRKALATRSAAETVFVATKGGHWRAGANEFPIDGRPATLRDHLEQSLRALGVDAIDLYQLHHPDPTVPIEESVGALADFQREGLVRFIGVSNFDDAQVSRALSVAQITSVQNHFSPFHAIDRALIARLHSEGVTYLAHSPLGGRRGPGKLDDGMPLTTALAASRGTSIQRVLLAWHLAVSPTLVPVVGARKPASITDSARAPELELSPGEFAVIDAEVSSLSATELPV